MKARPRILSEACTLFLEQGLDVSLDSIAVQAGTTRQTLYNHFPTKNALILETFQFLLDEMQPSVRVIVEDERLPLADSLLGLASLVQNHFYREKFVNFQRLLIQLLRQDPALFDTLQQRPSQRVKAALVQLLDKAKARGEIDVEDTSVNAACFLGSVMGYLLPATLISKELPDKQLLDAIAHNSVAVFLTAWHYRHL